MVTNGRCPRHSRVRDEFRGSAARRGYDREWRRLRQQQLNDYPLCADCEAAGRLQAAEEVHHRYPIAARPELRLDRGNLMSLCKSCHSRRTRGGSKVQGFGPETARRVFGGGVQNGGKKGGAAADAYGAEAR